MGKDQENKTKGEAYYDSNYSKDQGQCWPVVFEQKIHRGRAETNLLYCPWEGGSEVGQLSSVRLNIFKTCETSFESDFPPFSLG